MKLEDESKQNPHSDEDEELYKLRYCPTCGRPIVPTTSPYLYYCIHCDGNNHGEGWTI